MHGRTQGNASTYSDVLRVEIRKPKQLHIDQHIDKERRKQTAFRWIDSARTHATSTGNISSQAKKKG